MHDSPQRETGELPVGELLAERRLGPSLQRRTRRRPEESTPPNLLCPPNPSEIPDDARGTPEAQYVQVLHPSIPIPTPFKYAEDDTDDFRDFFDFDQAWLGAAADLPSVAATAQAHPESPRSLNLDASGSAHEGSANTGSSECGGSGHTKTESSPDLCLLSPPYSSGSSGSSGIYSILTPHTPYTPYMPYQDQEYCDLMYKLDLGAESPYLGSAYAEAFSSKVMLEHVPRPTTGSPRPDPNSCQGCPSPATGDKGKRASTDSANSDFRNTHCGICLSKAVSPCRTRCCEKLFCLGHIKEWLQSEGSSSLCPSCDAVCVLPPECLEDKDKAQKSGSASSQRSRSSSCDSTASASSSSAPASSTSSASSASFTSAQPSPSSSISVSNSGTCHTTTKTDPNANLVWSSTNVGNVGEDEETEDMWDVKATWKKNGGGSLDAVEMVRDVLAELMGFVGLSGGRRLGRSSAGLEEESRKMKRYEQPLGVFGTYGGIGSVMEVVRDVEEIGETGLGKRVMSIVGLVLILFVLFR